ncbi:CDIF630_02480 family spore surface protein [Clostridium cochlearium]|uniref:Domain of uncharacterized function (DUF3787) n=1 Tax=Clostridium cochlearium TaxID=1494 RepID=A0A239ZUV0_CLOCO|nr:DUF3787 domain-containing protein [Clostridium cochlearium]MBV1822051.1 DUF3787 domain-containing protein [Bacteroidales bacterium MSK.15.36]NSJ92530.1 DUF3787 domain-containing protein [Coprococcus sp. MSK.21.13]MBU5270407.1 DUF3787 domain-containing protein [Clostridium cochlearium]MCG4572360.1 DUF3787 domain-containing protein [Clostridium cochlearium]MCG4580104.1 DUF3787 domain-containing protein [Clostridium cochlearium]
MRTIKVKAQNKKTPIENHDTAAWANIEYLKPVSQVSVPSEIEIFNAKEWVDSNQK